MKPIIPIYPPRLFKDPAVLEFMRGTPSPISIEHSLITCPQCGESGWIGPKQRILAETGAGEVACVYCLWEGPEFHGATHIVSLNPDIDQAPRRI